MVSIRYGKLKASSGGYKRGGGEGSSFHGFCYFVASVFCLFSP